MIDVLVKELGISLDLLVSMTVSHFYGNKEPGKQYAAHKEFILSDPTFGTIGHVLIRKLDESKSQIRFVEADSVTQSEYNEISHKLEDEEIEEAMDFVEEFLERVRGELIALENFHLLADYKFSDVETPGVRNATEHWISVNRKRLLQEVADEFTNKVIQESVLMMIKKPEIKQG